MSGRQILFHDDARHQIAAGLDALADAVQVTLGPRGRNVLIERSWGAPEATKDGVTVAREVELTDRFANLGAQMVKEVAARTAELAGDGTTTATVLARAIYTAGARLVAAGIDPMELKRGIDAAVEVVVGELARQSIATQGGPEIAQVGIISANGDTTIGNLIALAMEKVGRDGAITIEEATSIETTLDVVVGMQLDRGCLSPYFVTDADRMEAVLTDAYILVVEQRLASMQELLPVLELVAQAGKPLLIVAEDVEREALATLVVNRLRGTLQVCAIKAPGYGDRRRAQLEDLATLTGGQAITADLGRRLEEVTLAELGRARTITIDKDRTTIVEGRGEPDAIAARVRTLRVAIAEADAGPEREALAQRLARLSGGVAVIKVGAASESELKEKKARVDDALHATRAAVEEGIVAGGGVALLRTLPALAGLQVTGDRRHGVAIIARAIEEPLRQIARNSNAEPAVVVARVVAGSGPFGYDAAHDRYTDLIAAGIIDPTKVVRVALQNAASVAGLMLTTEAAIAAGPAPSDRDR